MVEFSVPCHDYYRERTFASGAAVPVNLLMFRSVLLMLNGSAFGDSSFVW
jgi:hypothetical protein